MKIHADDPIAEDIEVLNLENGEFIRSCRWANQETGEYEVYGVDNEGLLIKTKGEFDTTILIGKIVLVYKGE